MNEYNINGEKHGYWEEDYRQWTLGNILQQWSTILEGNLC